MHEETLLKLNSPCQVSHHSPCPTPQKGQELKATKFIKAQPYLKAMEWGVHQRSEVYMNYPS